MQTDTRLVGIDGVRFVKELYPRLKEDDAAIERYRASLDLLPPIVLARGDVLVDGFHRWQAFRREGKTEIPSIDLGNLTDAEIFNESIKRNSTHGHQLSAKDKQVLAGRLWSTYSHLQGPERVDEIAVILAVSRSAVEKWTKDARKAEQDELQEKVLDVWLDCKTEREIAAEVLGDAEKRPTVQKWLDKLRKDPKFIQRPGADPDNAKDWGTVQHFDVWDFPKAGDSETGSYFGKLPPQIMENLLWLYTEPGDIVVDPFAGSGTTIEVAKRMGRRIWASDRAPSTPTLPIHEWDISTGWPDEAPSKPNLIFLDPPYWKQAEGRYSKDAGDMGNMSLGDFMSAWRSVVTACASRLNGTGRIAFIISPTQLEDGQVVDHAFDMTRVCHDLGLVTERRIIVLYQTQQATGQQVTWAREGKRLLKLYRDIVILRGR